MNGGLDVHVNITGDAAFITKLSGLGNVFEFSAALHRVGENLVNYFSGPVFKSQGGDFGTPWQSLAPSTVAFKAKHYRQFAAVPLQATGTMRRSFKAKSSALSLTIENEADYFKYHQSTAARSKIPRRPMFAINRTVKSIIKTSIEEAFIAKIGAL